MGLLTSKEAADSTPLLIILPILTLSFHKYCKNRFEPPFRKYPLEDAMTKDKLEKETEPELNMKADLESAYLHPIFHSFEEELEEEDEEERHREERSEVRVNRHETQSSELGTLSHNHQVHNSSSTTQHASSYEQSSSQYEYHFEARYN